MPYPLANFSPPDDSWDATLHAMGGHFLQSTAWMHVQAALGYQVTWRRGPDWQWSGAVRGGRFPRYLYAPYGPAAASDTAAALQDVAAASRSLALDFARVEPAAGALTALASMGARRAAQVQPRWTWVLDLRADVDTLRAGLERGHRSRINAAPRRGIRVYRTANPADIEIFLSLQRSARPARSFHGQPESYHRTVAQTLMPLGAAALYVAEAEGQALAASICFDFGPTRYYAHATSDSEVGRRLGAGPPLLWQMILDAKERGCTTFDFWGVTAGDDPSHPWAGFSRFKKAFGGRLLERAGTWELPLRPLRYRLYSVARRRR
jgi:Acetyltransferase (GNAT) domain